MSLTKEDIECIEEALRDIVLVLWKKLPEGKEKDKYAKRLERLGIDPYEKIGII